jgi:hypothetical protein
LSAQRLPFASLVPECGRDRIMPVEDCHS